MQCRSLGGDMASWGQDVGVGMLRAPGGRCGSFNRDGLRQPLGQRHHTAVPVRGRTLRRGEADAVLLVVSELVTNAVRHAGGVTGFRLAAGPGTVTVEVQDASPVPPRPRPSDPREPGGFGWHMVQVLAMDVQVDARPTGKTVTAMLPLAHCHSSGPPL
ncbi:ATP-binding protein [Streptomyces sp. NPDC055709]